MRRAILLLSTVALAMLLASGIAWAVDKTCQADTDCFGTKEADDLTGSNGNDRIFGLGGPDLIRGLASDDRISGGSGDDDVRGQGGRDGISGAGGDDELLGGSGFDTILAGNGDDTVFGGDTLGDTSSDTIGVEGDQANGFQDEVFCGGENQDQVFSDPNDILHNCSTPVLRR